MPPLRTYPLLAAELCAFGANKGILRNREQRLSMLSTCESWQSLALHAGGLGNCVRSATDAGPQVFEPAPRACRVSAFLRILLTAEVWAGGGHRRGRLLQ